MDDGETEVIGQLVARIEALEAAVRALQAKFVWPKGAGDGEAA
jgi:hypothetical protein